MQKLRFFIGSPSDIIKGFEKWQSEGNVEIKEIGHAISTFMAPMRTPPVSFFDRSSPIEIPAVTEIQPVTIISVMVIYEEK